MTKGVLYHLIQPLARVVFLIAVRQKVVGRELVPKTGPVILAITHLSHTDPITLANCSPRTIDFMARKEGFSNALKAQIMHMLNAFRVDRNGFVLPGVREALRRLDGERLVGIFPEAEVTRGSESVLNGGPMRAGAAWLSRRTDTPIIPCVVLGSRSLHNPIRWLPLKLGRSWIAFGEPLLPNHGVSDSRDGRKALTDALAERMRVLHGELVETYAIPSPYRDV
ncbi:MAG: 1-acyl-sn-glycerol-3-phosphate acyltransferase [Planctomycetota bacterium]|jgi:1-acyl-sn-glycerol-3-phosphate acyltransferase